MNGIFDWLISLIFIGAFVYIVFGKLFTVLYGLFIELLRSLGMMK